MPLGGWKLTVAATATSGALLTLLAARRLGAPVPTPAIVICAAVAAPIALAAGVQRLVYLWRGPSVVSFSRIEAVRCGGAEAEAIRAAAQLRGTLGGAGHVHRSRLALHALAYFATASLGAVALASSGSDAVGAWPLAVVAGAGVGAVLLPARPFYYREATNGDVVVSPPLARSLLAWSPSSLPATGEAATAVGRSSIGRGNSPNADPTASKPAGAGFRQEW